MAALEDNLRKVPPQNLEAESSVLGGILIENEAINVVIETLRPEDFYRESHRRILRAMIEITDRSERELAAELVREKLFRLLGEEVPYATAVQIDQFTQDGALRRIHATILVDKPGQKAIVIGKGGSKLKEVGTQARLDMERLFDGKVHLQLWVKVREGWAEDPSLLTRLGYD